MRIFKHALAVLLALFLLLGVPALCMMDVTALWNGSSADAVTQATMDLPDTPSGSFLVYISREAHGDALDQWERFFREEDYGVLLEDVHCLVISGDVTGQQLAERYQARLVKGQMTLRQENGVMVASRLEQDRFDMVIVSREMAEAWQLSCPDGAALVRIQEEPA